MLRNLTENDPRTYAIIGVLTRSVKQAYHFLFFEQMAREQATPEAALEPLVYWNDNKRAVQPRQG